MKEIIEFFAFPTLCFVKNDELFAFVELLLLDEIMGVLFEELLGYLETELLVDEMGFVEFFLGLDIGVASVGVPGGGGIVFFGGEESGKGESTFFIHFNIKII